MALSHKTRRLTARTFPRTKISLSQHQQGISRLQTFINVYKRK